jgi:pimeloyl-ACP methyl ester carboxylesterase
MLVGRLAGACITLTAAGAIIAGCAETSEQLKHGDLSTGQAVAAVHLPCLDTNQDLAFNAAGAPLQGGAEADAPDVDLNADGTVDERDAAFLDVDLRVTPEFDYGSCDDAPIEYLVGGGTPAIDCDEGSKAVIVVGIGGGVVDLRKPDNAAGVRWIVNGLSKELDARDYQTLDVISGPGLSGTDADLNPAMETFLTHSVKTLLDQYPCAQAVLVGHSHGAITASVVSSRLEAEYADRIAAVAMIDRVDDLYAGDLAARPHTVSVFNVFETNDMATSGSTFDAPNVENWDASAVEAPEHGEDGGESKPITHTTIDNSSDVRDRVIDEIVERLGA